MAKLHTKIRFNELSWAALCFYYRSIADRKYCNIMADLEFMQKLRETPFEITPVEFERKILFDYINIRNYDILFGHKFAQGILEKIIGLQPDISALQDTTLLNCNFSDSNIIERIQRIYSLLSPVPGLWVTGVSKIAHVLNPKLHSPLNLDISTHFGLLEGSSGLIDWLRVLQESAIYVTEDFHKQGLTGSPEEYISERLGYIRHGCHKSLVKFLDEYYWLRFADNLPIPPQWVPK